MADFRETLDSDSGESDCRQSAKIFLVRMTKARTSPQPFSLYGQPTYDVESLIEIGCWQRLILVCVTESLKVSGGTGLISVVVSSSV